MGAAKCAGLLLSRSGRCGSRDLARLALRVAELDAAEPERGDTLLDQLLRPHHHDGHAIGMQAPARRLWPVLAGLRPPALPVPGRVVARHAGGPQARQPLPLLLGPPPDTRLGA